MGRSFEGDGKTMMQTSTPVVHPAHAPEPPTICVLRITAGSLLLAYICSEGHFHMAGSPGVPVPKPLVNALMVFMPEYEEAGAIDINTFTAVELNLDAVKLREILDSSPLPDRGPWSLGLLEGIKIADNDQPS